MQNLADWLDELRTHVETPSLIDTVDRAREDVRRRQQERGTRNTEGER
jgi:hypothetical protein